MGMTNEHRKGPQHPTVILLEYGDYECPYSGKLASVIEDLLKEFDMDLAFLYRHFPMGNIHPNSGLAAMAAEAANVQGKFWEMHQLLFKNQHALSLENILALAESLNLNLKTFMVDLENEKLWEKVKSNIDSGSARNIVGTPALYLNGNLYEGSSAPDFLREAIENEIEKRKNSPFRSL